MALQLTLDDLIEDKLIENIQGIGDALVKEIIISGLSLRCFTESTDVSYETVRARIKESGYHEIWLALRKLNTQRKRRTFYQEIANLLATIALDKSRHEGFVVEKAAQYFFHYSLDKSSSTTFEQLMCLFGAYKTALDQGKRLSIDELAQMSRLHKTSVSRIFGLLDVKTMYREIERHPLTEEQEERIRRVSQLKISAYDAAYFLHLNPVVVNLRFKRMRNQYPNYSYPRFGKEQGRRGRNDQLTLRRASQIFEAQDLGFGVEEICELLDAPGKMVRYAQQHRESYSSQIIEVLDAAYNKEHSTPYL